MITRSNREVRFLDVYSDVKKRSRLLNEDAITAFDIEAAERIRFD